VYLTRRVCKNVCKEGGEKGRATDFLVRDLSLSLLQRRARESGPTGVTQRTRPRSHLCHRNNGTARAPHVVHQSLLAVRQRVTRGYTSCHAAAPVGVSDHPERQITAAAKRVDGSRGA